MPGDFFIMKNKRIAIVGTGMIGGSLALRLHEKKLASRLVGVEQDASHARVAVEAELVDEVLTLNEAISTSDIIILCIPVDQVVTELPGILDQVDRQIVMDVGSTKGNIIEAVEQHPRRGRFVATHPMWGTEFSGPLSARRDSFTGRAVILCNENESDDDSVAWVRNMYEKIGMHILTMEARAHDLHAAYVSHISHITSFALANTVLEKEKAEQAIFEMASSGFESTVRLAKSHASMWVPIFLQNRKDILDVLEEHLFQLQRFRDALIKGDAGQLQHLIEEANRIRRILK
jgi:prephenate dehydrogenase